MRGPGPSDSPPSRAAIGIPTYRRPQKLLRLLTSLEPSLRAFPAQVLVADNACDQETRQVVAAFSERWPRTLYLPVPERGISAARNALIGAFLAAKDPAPWLAMLDDDLAVGADWLERMLAAAEHGGAGFDAVGAPYATGKTSLSFVVRNSIFVKRPRMPSGPCAPLSAAGNILLSRGLLARMPAPHFLPAYGLSGGEDYDFFRRAAGMGARFAWCDEAFAEEDVDLDRLSAGAVFNRYYSTGNYMALIDRTHEGVGRVWRRHLGGIFKALGIGAAGLARLDRERALRGLFLTLFTLGALMGLAGFRVHRYR